MAKPPRPRVYLAGPDVFRIDCAEHMRKLVLACEAAGLEALPPSDGMPPITALGKEAEYIFETNMARLRQADGVIANLEPFRGTEPDSGTVFEVGAAVAMGLPVVAYGVSGAYAARVKRLMKVVRANGVLRDPKNYVVEDFDLPLNLMLACSVGIEDTAEDALAALAEWFADLGPAPVIH
jgi:nucleoside 2-deoxyribosyltransferase